MSSPVPTRAPAASRRGRLVRRTVWAALLIAVIGGTLLAVVETSLAAWLTAQQSHGGALSYGLVLAALGKAALTHALVWCPLMILCGLVISALFLRPTATPPEPLLWAIFVLLAGLAVVPADLALASRASLPITSAACAAVVMLAGLAYVATAATRTLLRARRFRRFTRMAACLGALLTLGSGIVLVPSPLYSADGYRIEPPAAAIGSPAGRNVLWIVLDTVRADRLSCQGCDTETTPFLDDWASQAIVYDSAVANAIWTVPSHASMFSGLPVRQHGADAAWPWLDNSISTVAEVLAANGYATASFSNNPWVTPTTNLTQGFAESQVVCRLRRLSRFSLEFLAEQWGITPRLPWLDNDYGAALTNQLVARWLDHRSEDDGPFFLFINYMEAHLPYRVPKRYRRMYMTDQQVHRSYDLRRRVYGDLVKALNIRFNVEGGDFLTAADREVVRRQYLAAVRYLDDRVGELIGTLEQRGLLGNTLVIITSDHGEHLGAHGMWSHRFHTYNDLTWVPLMIREPGQKQGLRVAVPVQPSDLYPTIVNAALGRSDPGPGYDSRDLIALARTGRMPRVAIAHQGEPDAAIRARLNRAPDPALAYKAQPRTAAVDGHFKYIASADGRRELYDVVADPGELHNLIDSHPGRADRLAAHIAKWRRAVPQHRPSPSEAAPTLSEETRAELQALGYLGGS